MGVLNFEEVARPPDGDTPPAGGGDITSDDLVCQVCNTPLVYSGRGPKPKFCEDHKRNKSAGGTGSRKNPRAADVERACETLDNLYTAVTLPVFMLSPKAGSTWVTQVEGMEGRPGLSERNRTHLANNKPLVDRINKTGERGSTLAFTLSHVFAVVPVIMVLRADLVSRQAANIRETPPETPGNVHPIDPDAPFRKGQA